MRSRTAGMVTMAISVAVIALVAWFTKPDMKPYEAMRTPRIVERADERMLSVHAAGNVTNLDALGREITTKYYQCITTAFRPEGYHPIRTRSADGVSNVTYGLPLTPMASDFFITNDGPFSVSIATWTNGLVAEMLFEGKYEAVPSAYARLREYISSQGYMPTGIRDEEYIRSPGGLIRYTPATILRMPVMKKPR